MRYLIIGYMLILSACSSTPPAKTNNPDFVSGYISVLGTGKTIEEAKQSAFTLAVKYVSGSVMLTQQEAVGNKMVRDEIVEHSSGYVEDYRIKSTDKIGNTYSVVMDVKVRSSKIAETILGKNLNTTTELDGSNIVTQSSTIIKSRESGLVLLDHVIDDYFKYGVNVVNTNNWRLDNETHDIIVEVNYVATFNQKWFESLDEALKILSNTDYNGDTVDLEYKKEGKFFSTHNYYFLNRDLATNLHNRLSPDNYIKMTFRNDKGTVVYSTCDKPLIYHDPAYYRGGRSFKGEFEVRVEQGSWLHQHFKEVKYVDTKFIINRKECFLSTNTR